MGRKLRKTGLHPFLTFLFSALLVVYILIPFAWLFISAISPKIELSAVPPHWFPRNPSFDNFTKLLGNENLAISSGETPRFGTAMRNSLIVSLGANLMCLVIGIFAAYAFSRLRFRLKNAFFMTIIAIRMLPEIALVLPLYMIMRKLGMADSKVFMTIVYASFILPFVIWILKSYFDSIPASLEEAALIEGAGRFAIIINVVLPLAMPGIIATCIFSVLTAWDEFLFALIFTSTYRSKTLTVAISEFTTRHMVDYGMMCAGGVLAALPPVLIALFLQKYIVSGLSEGGVKE